MKVVILGYGNVGRFMTKALSTAGIEVAQIYNRSKIKHRHITTTRKKEEIIKDAGLYLICVSDTAIKEVSELLSDISSKSVVAHTAGSVSSKILMDSHDKYGSFYPLQTISQGKRKLKTKSVPILINGSSSKVERKLKKLAKKCFKKVVSISDEDKVKLHLPAVIVNNFTNHLYARAYDYCEENGLSFELLIPLINETSSRLDTNVHPKNQQTGPAKRQDKGTIKRHAAQLGTDPELRKIYNYLTNHISNYHEGN